MATIKAYSDLQQSKKLAEILPLESADMIYTMTNGYHTPFIRIETIQEMDKDDVYAWSIAALFNILPEGVIENYYVPNLQKENGKYSIAYGNDELLCIADNPVDACYEMILKLHELNVL